MAKAWSDSVGEDGIVRVVLSDGRRLEGRVGAAGVAKLLHTTRTEVGMPIRSRASTGPEWACDRLPC